MYKTFKYRLWTNANQERELAIMLETHRRLYNKCLELKSLAWEQYGVSISFVECCKWYARNRKFNPYYNRINSSSAQATLRRLDHSFEQFYRKVRAGEKNGYPKFKNKDQFNSIKYPDPKCGVKLIGNRLRVQYVGTIRVKLHRPIEGVIRTTSIVREASKWYVAILCELPDVPIRDTGKPSVGVDMGLSRFFTASDGKSEPSPRFLKKSLPELRRKQRSFSRKKKNGSNRRKARKSVARVHAKVKNQRKDHHHKTALNLVRRYDLIAVERLDIQGMIRNGRFNRAIYDIAWGDFVGILKHKAECAGVRIAEVDPQWTSQECSICGKIVLKDLFQRRHSCECGCSLDRDENAARNILARGLLAQAGPAGLNVGQKVKRAPRRPLVRQG